MFDLRDKVVTLTGASSGIGRETALLMAERGACMALCARRLDRLEQLCREVEEQGGARPLVAACDVRDRAQVEAFRDQVRKELGEADVLVCNAGRGAFRPIERLTPEEAEAVVGTNLMGVVHCVQAFLPGMLERGSGHLVFVSSVLAELPAPEHALYAATKAGVSALAESLEYELEPKGIRVVLIEPGLVKSEFAQVSGTPLERFDQVPYETPEEAAERIVWAVEREKRKYVADLASRIPIALRRHFPRLSRPLFRWAIRRMYGR